MEHRNVRRTLTWLLIGVCLLAGIVTLTRLAEREMRHEQVETATARFEAHPSLSEAEELARLLAKRVPTSEQGERILRLILNFKVTTRSTYRADRVPTVAVEWPLASVTRQWNGKMDHTGKYSFRLEGQQAPTERTMRLDRIAFNPALLRCGTEPLAVGTHSGQLCVDYTLTYYDEVPPPISMRLEGLFQDHPPTGRSREAGSYEARVEIPVKIVVAEAADAEQVTLVEDPKLAEAVLQAFACHRRDGHRVAGLPRSVAYNGVTHLKWENVPIAVAFEPVLRLSDGREVPYPSLPIGEAAELRTRPGGSGYVDCTGFMDPLPVAVPGHYDATIVLKPDPNAAYDDPKIKAIWNGTLEFPISFSLTVDANKPRS